MESSRIQNYGPMQYNKIGKFAKLREENFEERNKCR
jgi:hypothetical protein